jgi:hypothetical protein
MSELLTNEVQVELGVKFSEILGNMVILFMEFVKIWHNSKVVHINTQICESIFTVELQSPVNDTSNTLASGERAITLLEPWSKFHEST